jgi:hypothetical protein
MPTLLCNLEDERLLRLPDNGISTLLALLNGENITDGDD